MAFNLAQTFYIDKSTVRNAEHVTLTSIDLFFKSKPRERSNRSGILKPGVSIFLIETRDNDVPDHTRVVDSGFSRCDYDSIITTADASIATKFNFGKPVVVKTNKSYAIAIAYDGNEDFSVWSCKEGEVILGTNTTTSGSTAQNVGKYYEYSSIVSSKTNGDQTIQEKWKPLNNVDIKFMVYCGIYSANTVASQISSTYLLPSDPVEYILFDRYHSQTSNIQSSVIDELVFQETPVIYGPVRIVSNSVFVTVTSNNINFSTLIKSSQSTENRIANSEPVVGQKSYIVLRNGNSSSANINIREVVSVVSNTEIEIDRVPTFTNATGTFSVAAAGKLSQRGYHWYKGRWWNASTNEMESHNNRKVDIIRVSETNANSTVRFVNNMVQSITISSGGTGYSNADVVTVYPMTNANTANVNHINYIPSYSNGIANVITNGSGTITGIAVTNAGYGINGNVAVTITTSGGTSANLVPLIGSSIRGETSNAMFANTVVTNVEVHRVYPHLNILDNQHHEYKIYQHHPYYIIPGTEHVLNASSPAMTREVTTFKNSRTSEQTATDGRVYVIASRSNEAVMTNNVSVTISNGAVVATGVKSSSIVEVSIVSNSVFSLPMIISDDVYNYKNIINNDYTNEHKGNGHSLAKHISKKVTFAENRDAEDILVYMDVYKPAGTSVKVYARLHNKTDPESFDDKDWTELEVKSNNSSKVSSKTDETDLIEFTYGLPVSSPSVNTLTGSAQLTLNQSNAVGVGTTWSTDLAANDVVKVYSTLFPQNYVIAAVSAVTNNTLITLDTDITNTSLTSGTMKVDLIGRPGTTEIGRPFSAWKNISNSYIVRYYNSTLSKFDTYNSFAIKLVLLSDNTSVVPKVANIRAVGVSA